MLICYRVSYQRLTAFHSPTPGGASRICRYSLGGGGGHHVGLPFGVLTFPVSCLWLFLRCHRRTTLYLFAAGFESVASRLASKKLA